MTHTPLAFCCKRIGDLSPAELEAWRALVESVPGNRRAFLTPSFCMGVERTHGQVRLILVRREDALVGFLPIQKKDGLAGRFGVFEPVGGSMSDYFGLVAAPGLQIDLKQMLQAAGVGCIEFTHLDEETQVPLGLHGEQPRIGLRTRVHGKGSSHWDALRTIDKKLVNDTERRERKLVAEHGPVLFELQSNSPESDLRVLIALKQAQYDRTGREKAPLFDQRNIRLLELLLASGDELCAPYLSVLRVGGKPIALHLGLRCGSTLHVWFPAYEPAFASFSPGRILLRRIIERGSHAGIELLDRGEGDNQAKRDFANEEHHYLMGVWHQGFSGTIGRLGLALHWRFQS